MISSVDGGGRARGLGWPGGRSGDQNTQNINEGRRVVLVCERGKGGEARLVDGQAIGGRGMVHTTSTYSRLRTDIFSCKKRFLTVSRPAPFVEASLLSVARSRDHYCFIILSFYRTGLKSPWHIRRCQANNAPFSSTIHWIITINLHSPIYRKFIRRGKERYHDRNRRKTTRPQEFSRAQ